MADPLEDPFVKKLLLRRDSPRDLAAYRVKFSAVGGGLTRSVQRRRAVAEHRGWNTLVDLRCQVSADDLADPRIPLISLL